MTTSQTTTLTAGRVLFGSSDVEASVDSLFREHSFLGPAGLPGRLPSTVSAALQHEVAAATRSLLELDLIDVLVGAWRKQADLVAAARRTAQIPGSSEIVQLATHRVTSVHHPYIDVVVDDVRVGCIHLELQFVFTIRGLLAVIRHGALVAVRSGECTVDARFAIEGVVVVRRDATVDLRGQVQLGRGVPLLGQGAAR